jgi:hypothetical protein
MAQLAQDGGDMQRFGSGLYQSTTITYCTDDTSVPGVRWMGTLLTTWTFQILMSGMPKQQPNVSQ